MTGVSAPRLIPQEMAVASSVVVVAAAFAVVVGDGLGGRWWIAPVLGLIVAAGVLLFVPPLPAEADRTLVAPPARPASPTTATIRSTDLDVTVIRPAAFAIAPTRVIQRTRSKFGNAPDENDDAVAVSDDGRRYAVADGASSAFAAGAWARLLVDAFVVGADVFSPEGRRHFVIDQAATWQAGVSSAANWWEGRAGDRGSFAAFVGVDIDAAGRAAIAAVGDCCAFVLDSSGGLLDAFPLSDPHAFDATPALIPTFETKVEWLFHESSVPDSGWIVAASDAVAAWLLADHSRFAIAITANAHTWDEVCRVEVEAGRMVNDDLSIVAVQR
jgi:hypothetical protein